MVARPSYLYNGNTYTEKITSWSWNSPRVSVNEEIRHLVKSYTLKLQNLDFNFFFDHVKFSQNYIRFLPVNTYSFIDQGNDHVSILGTCKSAEKCWSDQLFSTQCGSVSWLRETSGWFHVKVFALWTTTKQKNIYLCRAANQYGTSVFCTDFTCKIREYEFGLQNTEIELCQFCHLRYYCQNKAYLFWVANQSRFVVFYALKPSNTSLITKNSFFSLPHVVVTRALPHFLFR